MLSQDQINELWKQGYTLTRRMQDPTNLTPREIPATRAYQWWHLEHDKFHYESGGWAPVPNDRHNGRFAPWGAPGNIEWNGLGLFEKPRFEVDAEHAANHAKAHQNVADAKDLMAQIVKDAGHELTEHRAGPVEAGIHVNAKTKTIDTTVRIPQDMQPHIVQILAERDRLSEQHKKEDREVAAISQKFHEHMKANPNDSMWPTLHSFMMPKAIENVRASLASAQEA